MRLARCRVLLFLLLLCALLPASAYALDDIKGATEGEGEEAGTPDCALTKLELLSPVDGATWYLSDTSGGIDLSLLAEADCAEDVASVSFFVQQAGGGSQQIGAADTEAPFSADFESFFTPTIGQDLIWSAEAKRVTQPTANLTVQAKVSLVDTDTVDSEEDGLPDDPFGAMSGSDDRWYAAATLDGEEERVVTWIRAIRGDDPTELGNLITAELRSPESTGQKLTLTFDRRLIEGTQLALLVVRFAPTLSALVGSTEAAEFTREPSGALDGAGQYLALSILVSNNNGATYSEIGLSRLAARPVIVKLEGLDLDATREYTFAGHDAKLSEANDSIALIAETASWQSVATESIDTAAGTITAEMTELGVYAPFYIVDEDELCPLGICLPGSIIIELLTIAALFILNLVPGGVGGGDSPCFIATAAYGTPLAGDLDVLRAFRDEWLLNNSIGTAFTDVYYRVSPLLADAIAGHALLAAAVRVLLSAIIALLHLGAAAWVLPIAGVAWWSFGRWRKRVHKTV